MKKRTAYIMKRFICLILMLLVCFNVSIMAHASNSDKDGVIKSGDYKYTLLDDGTAKLVEMLVGDKITFEIPSEIDGYTVTAIGGSVYPYSKVNKVIIPSSLTIIENNPFKDMECLVEIEVSPDHPTFAVINDVLFRKADKCLVCFPGGRTGNLVDNIYSIPEGIEVIGDCAFSRCKASKIIIPESVITIGDYAFQFSELKSIAIPKSVKSIGNNPFLFQEWAENNKIDLTVSPDNPYFYFSERLCHNKWLIFDEK